MKRKIGSVKMESLYCIMELWNVDLNSGNLEVFRQYA